MVQVNKKIIVAIMIFILPIILFLYTAHDTYTNHVQVLDWIYDKCYNGFLNKLGTPGTT